MEAARARVQEAFGRAPKAANLFGILGAVRVFHQAAVVWSRMDPGGAVTERRRRIKFRVGTRLVELADHVAARPPLRFKRLGEDHYQIPLIIS